MSSVQNKHGVIARGDGANNGYVAGCEYNGSGHHIKIYKLVAGTLTELGNLDTQLDYNPGDAGTYTFVVNGTALTIYKNGFTMLSVTDSTFSTGTHCGIFAYIAGSYTLTYDNYAHANNTTAPSITVLYNGTNAGTATANTGYGSYSVSNGVTSYANAAQTAFLYRADSHGQSWFVGPTHGTAYDAWYSYSSSAATPYIGTYGVVNGSAPGIQIASA